MSTGAADPERVRTSITSMNALLDPLKHLYLNLADADGKTTRARCLFALADTGILDDLPCADVGADLGHGFSDDVEVEWTYEDFVNVLGAAIAHRTAHRKPLPAAPRGVAQRQLRDLFHLCCNDFDRARPKSNASRLTLHQWLVVCDGADLLTRRFTRDAAAVVFARCRRGAETDLGLDQFITCLASLAVETGKTFEAVVSAVSTSPLCTGGAENVAPAKDIAPGAAKDTYKTPGKVRVPTVFGGAKPKTPGAALKTPGASLKTPGAALKTPGASLKTPGASLKTPGASLKTPGASLKTPGAPNDVRYTAALESAVESPDAKSFETHDADGDGLLNRHELASLLAQGDSASVDGAIELVSKLFDDVDLDRDGRVCLAEYEAFCKKARRTLRRRTMSSAHGPTASAPVPATYATDARLEEMFVAYCVVGAAKTPAKERTTNEGSVHVNNQNAFAAKRTIDERRFLRVLKDAKLTGPGFSQQQAQLCFHSQCARNERKLDHAGFLRALGAVVAHSGPGATYDSIADAVKSLPIPDKLSAAVIERTIAPQPPARAGIGVGGPRPHSARAGIGSFSTSSSSSGDSGFGARANAAVRTRPKSAKPRVSVSFADDDDVKSDVKSSDVKSDVKSDAKSDVKSDAKSESTAPDALLAAFDRRDAEANDGDVTGVASIGVCRLALADVAGLNGADAAAVASTFRDVFEAFAVRAKLRREKLGEFKRKFDARVANLALAGAPLVPPVQVPPMSAPQSDAISGVFDSTVGTSAGAPDFMTAAEFASLLSAAGLIDTDADADAVEVTFCRCVGGKPRGDADFASFVTALAAIAGERRLTFFQVAAPVVDAAMRARAARGKEKEAGNETGERDDGAAEPEAAPEPEPEAAEKAEPEASEPEKAEAAQTAAPPLTEEERAVWAQEFKSHDEAESKSGVVDVERVSFALAKLRLLEDVDVALAASELEASVKIVDPSGVGALDLDAFIAVGAAVRALKLGGRAKPSAKPVPVQREYVFDDSHPFAAKFRAIADVNGEIDGDSYRALLDRAGLLHDGDGRSSETPETRLTNAGAAVVFARAKARHPGHGRRVPYRIFLGALSLSAGHLGMSFAEVVERIMATEL